MVAITHTSHTRVSLSDSAALCNDDFVYIPCQKSRALARNISYSDTLSNGYTVEGGIK